MKRVFIGHRGVGKSSLLKRHKEYFPEIRHFDLDLEIESRTGKKILDIFIEHGEDHFRKLEQETFFELSNQSPHWVIAVGAGYNVQSIPTEYEKVYVSRETDIDGRIFLNRPRLNSEMDPLAEYKYRYNQREFFFQQVCDWVYNMPEGLISSSDHGEVEKKVLELQTEFNSAYFTIQNYHQEAPLQYLKRYRKIELRDDLIPLNDFFSLNFDFTQQVLVSIREGHFDLWENLLLFKQRYSFGKKVEIDIDEKFILTLPQSASSRIFQSVIQNLDIISSHKNDLNSNIEALEKAQTELSRKVHLKCCPLVSSWEELIEGDMWMNEDPQYRSFLPRSIDGRWKWYRLLRSDSMKLNFVRGRDQNYDQPTVFDFFKVQNKRLKAAVIGQPIYYSWSPLQHHKYFSQKKATMVDISIAEADFEVALPWLAQKGVIYFSVTSPLKKIAASFSQVKSAIVQELETANTLYFDSSSHKWFSENTDYYGFKKAIQAVADKNIQNWAIWGGSGTLGMMQKVLPRAICYSSRTGEVKDSLNQDLDSTLQPEVLIWAAPQKEQFQRPPKNWNIKYIIDLNYRENSSALQWAQELIKDKKDVQYFSGQSMFTQQALAQQQFWSQNER